MGRPPAAFPETVFFQNGGNAILVVGACDPVCGLLRLRRGVAMATPVPALPEHGDIIGAVSKAESLFGLYSQAAPPEMPEHVLLWRWQHLLLY